MRNRGKLVEAKGALGDWKEEKAREAREVEREEKGDKAKLVFLAGGEGEA